MSSSHGSPAVCTSLLDSVPVTVTLSSSHGLGWELNICIGTDRAAEDDLKGVKLQQSCALLFMMKALFKSTEIIRTFLKSTDNCPVVIYYGNIYTFL
ncbi:unnamed protein product [Sphagnum tenellum]